MTKWVYNFGDGSAEGEASMKNLLGGKGANLAEMSNLGLPVPPGFTITTEVCTSYYDNDNTYPADLADQVAASIKVIEETVGAKFGDEENPLLVSVRSGARVSMPGMMDTVLNLGLNDVTVKALAKQSGDERFAYDSYRRFIQMYSDVVLGVDHYLFEELLEIHKEENGFTLDTELEAEDWKELSAAFKAKAEDELGRPFPQDVNEQLWGAIDAVFGSWMIERAFVYRRLHNIPHTWGTAVNVQSMVFGNMGDDCATGVAFTRDPSTGENTYYGEYLINAQGEDVVAGIRTPQNLTKASRIAAGSDMPSMEESMPEVYGQLADVFQKLEAHYRDMQDIEFTVQKQKLWILQTRSGKRTAPAALKIAVEMVHDDIISKDEALLRVDPGALDQLLHPTLDPDAARDVLTKGLPASPGAASGKVVFTADEAEILSKNGEDVILVRIETSPEDIHGMHAARGILTSRGGMTSHAAVVARGMGRPCVSGAGSLHINMAEQTITVDGRVINNHDIITIDGGNGEVMAGKVATIKPELGGHFGELMAWADDKRELKVRTNAETPLDASAAREFGAEGIGLCRTEHMFFDATRIINVRQMIMSSDEEGRRAALDKLLPDQRSDFVELFTIMKGLPVTVRLLDPPLHEFLPHKEEDFVDVANAMGVDMAFLKRRAEELHEFNPMLGHRGCRLGISFPEIYEMQARAIIEAALEVSKTLGEAVIPEIMVPLVGSAKELEILKELIIKTADEIIEASGEKLEYMVGTMIELPRAALQAGEIANHAEFFSFGTNDLTQTTYGISRDDSARFLDDYLKADIYDQDPFVSLDQDGVGELVKIGVERGRNTRNDLKVGICGEHGGDPASVEFCHRNGLDYVSCSPYRVPIARLAAAQAVLRK
ncbi:pyruvate, phosphate dikinase [Pseudemcibacter aquimaris]|uniref:pyruvate, phosphate dikinase n=1 Tax=Pseudemcibacter aquimaris TaxID=2857064 RepID=UPI0020123FA5|nr:pyruvate, phosphate dikinase [Pseudemcibacter aquimaris]MCC3862439.1 pyruvate, phosphate dikinase [Pseudemcibacter aquimaris]WDU59132.1 pyruvate, phosphate dikinase [Pseudemcibacter aquimaris]